jgi:predicted transcriptional regulator
MTDAGPEQSTSADLLRMTAEVVAAYVRNNPLPAAELSSIIHTVHGSLAALDGDSVSNVEPLRPAVSIRRSVQPDHIVCLEDGKKLKMLKRHLRTTYGMSPEEYRAKWGLPPDYPMVAPNYAKQRSEFAKQIGLGRKSGRRKRR